MHDRLDWAAVGQQRYHHQHRLRLCAQPVENRPFRRRKRLLALIADVPFILLAMDADTGRVLWQYQSTGSVASGCAIVGNDIFWPLGPGNVVNAGIVDQDKVIAFTIDR